MYLMTTRRRLTRLALLSTLVLPLTVQADAAPLSCPKTPLAPYTGPLNIDSRYDQTDATKSTLSDSQSDESKAIHAHISEYGKMLVAFSDYYVKANTPAKKEMALLCTEEWLTPWAQAHALETDEATKTGIAMRKWTLAGMAAVIIKLQTLSEGNFVLNHSQRVWLNTLAGKVIQNYSPRMAPDFAWFNNHDYWAAWAVAATGLALGQQDNLDWSMAILRRGLSQITPVTLADQPKVAFGYLPNEVGRASLATNYSHYALAPLVMLAHTARQTGHPLSADEEQRLFSLVNFTVWLTLYPEQTAPLITESQKAIPAQRMAWLIPFLQMYPNHALARQLYTHFDGEVDGFSQLGGLIQPLYPWNK
ncbi:MAG: alginate lyase family protein [Hahellaceae bacterium]|nr:alginate lyase family protein [Hahellaceae bacterium]MCP5169121.1 alginate lyase family protein [Hahellaceae bacterium]